MSDLDLYNAFKINDLQRDTKRSAMIMELGQRAEFIANTTSSKPKSWYEYKTENQQDVKLSPLKKALIGAVVSAMIGIAVGTGLVVMGFSSAVPVALAISMLIPGAIVGQGIEAQRENTANDKLVANYSAYLDGFEKSNSKARAVSSSINYRDDHAERLKRQTGELSR